jgi:PAS domain-containing protein
MRDLKRALRTGGFLLFLAGTLAISFLSFQRKIESFSRIDFNARASRGEIEIVTPPDRAPSTLRAGDRIVLIDGAPVAGYADPSGALSRPPFPHRLAVVRSGDVVEATLGSAAPAIDLPYLFLAFVGILYLLIGLVTLGRERSAASTLFALFCVSAFAIDVLTPSGPVDGMWKAIWLTEDFFRAIGPALLLHFFLIFPKPAGGRRRPAIYLLPAIYLGAQIAISIPGIGIAPDRLAFWVEFLERFWLLYFAGYSAAAIVRIVGAARNRTDVASQRQARWVALGTTFGLAPFLLLYALPRTFGYSSEWAACAGIVPLVFVPLGFAYALWRWRLWDVDIFAREAAATAAAVFLGAAAFVLVNALLNRVLVGFASGAKNLLAFGSGLFLASLLVPVKRRFSDAIERFQYGETYRARRALLDFSREWRGIRDVALLAEALASALSDALKVSPCRIFLFDRPLPAGLSRDALLEKFAASDSVRVRSATFPSGEDLTLLRLHEDGYRHLSALKSGGRIVGALAFGLKEGKVPLSSEDHALLSTVLAQASLAFENAELYRALEKRMEEIRSLQEFQEGVIRSSSAGIVVQDARGTIVSANPAFESLIGAGEDLVGRSSRRSFEILRALEGARRALLRGQGAKPTRRGTHLPYLRVAAEGVGQRPGRHLRRHHRTDRPRRAPPRRSASRPWACSPPASRTRSTRPWPVFLVRADAARRYAHNDPRRDPEKDGTPDFPRFAPRRESARIRARAPRGARRDRPRAGDRRRRRILGDGARGALGARGSLRPRRASPRERQCPRARAGVRQSPGQRPGRFAGRRHRLGFGDGRGGKVPRRDLGPREGPDRGGSPPRVRTFLHDAAVGRDGARAQHRARHRRAPRRRAPPRPPRRRRRRRDGLASARTRAGRMRP